jgi:hypothetical protein
MNYFHVNRALVARVQLRDNQSPDLFWEGQLAVSNLSDQQQIDWELGEIAVRGKRVFCEGVSELYVSRCRGMFLADIPVEEQDSGRRSMLVVIAGPRELLWDDVEREYFRVCAHLGWRPCTPDVLAKLKAKYPPKGRATSIGPISRPILVAMLVVTMLVATLNYLLR